MTWFHLFLSVPRRTDLMKLSINNHRCNGLPGLSYLIQKVDSKMCFTTQLCFFSPTRNSLINSLRRYSSFRCLFLSCFLLYLLTWKLSIFLCQKFQKILFLFSFTNQAEIKNSSKARVTPLCCCSYGGYLFFASQFDDFNQRLTGFFHRFQCDKFILPVEIFAASKNIRRRQSHQRDFWAVCPTAKRLNVRRDS